MGHRPFRKRQKIRGMGELRAGEGTVRRQLLQPVLADRFEHGVARLPARACLLLQEARVDQRGNPLQDVDPHRAGNGLGGLHGEATNEDGERVEEDLLRCGEQAIAPGDGIAHRLLPSGQVTPATGEQRQPRLQPRQQRCRREHLDPGGSQFDGERQAIQAVQIAATAAALSDVRVKSSWTACARSRKSRTASDAATSSTGACAIALASASGGTACSRSPEIRSRTRLVTRTVTARQTSSSSATRGAASTTCSKLSSTRSRRLSRRNAVTRSASGLFLVSRTPTAWRDGGNDESGVRDGSKTDEDHAVREGINHVRRDLNGEAGLAHAARTGQGEQPHIVPPQEVTDRYHLSLAADERRERERKGGKRGGGVCSSRGASPRAGAASAGTRCA